MDRRVIPRFLLPCVAALLCEGLALAAVGGEHWHRALLCHAGCSVGLAIAAAGGEWKQRVSLAASVAVWVFCVPVIGPIGCCTVVLPASRVLRRQLPDDVSELEPSGAEVMSATAGTVRCVADALLAKTSEAERVAAVLSLRHAQAARAVPRLRSALLDEHEDVRLLAYAMLERREQKLRASLEDKRKALELADTDARAALLEVLCEQHWELVSGGFVDGAALQLALTAAARYGSEALQLRPSGSLALVLAQVRLRAGDARAAQVHANTARVLGVASSVLAATYAEIAFAMECYERVAPALQLNKHASLARPELSAFATSWAGRELS